MVRVDDDGAASSAPAPPVAAAASPNPFREQEKKYQLHFDQKMTLRKGRLRCKKGKLVERQTDLSEVLDFEVSRRPPPGSRRPNADVFDLFSLSLSLFAVRRPGRAGRVADSAGRSR